MVKLCTFCSFDANCIFQSLAEEPSAGPSSPQTVQALMREATQLLKEPVEVVSGSLRTYTKRLQVRSVCTYLFFHIVSHNFL